MLFDKERDWAKKNKFRHYEATIRVHKGRHKAMAGDIGKIAGDGKYGFTSRRTSKNEDACKMVEGLDGQLLKSRKTIVRKRKNTCILWSPTELFESQLDSHVLEKRLSEKLGRVQDVVKEQRIAKKETRKRNRNHKARRTQRKLKRAA